MKDIMHHSIQFYEDQVDFITLVEKGLRKTYIVMRRVCENLGLAWQSQQRKLREHHRFIKGTIILPVPTPDGSRQESLCLQRSKFFLWLYSINPDKVSPKIRSKLVKYQDDVEDAIERYFVDGLAVHRDSYKINQQEIDISQISDELPELIKLVTAQVQDKYSDQQKIFEQIFVRQEQFQQYALSGLDRIEAVLAENQPHDIFHGWQKVKKLVDDMTIIYQLSSIEKRQYFRELCQAHQIHLPEKALLESDSSFISAQEIAGKMGIFSMNNKPHSRAILSLIRFLNLNQDKYCQKSFGAGNNQIIKYSDNIIPHIAKWFKDNGYPEKMELLDRGSGKARHFRIVYKIARS